MNNRVKKNIIEYFRKKSPGMNREQHVAYIMGGGNIGDTETILARSVKYMDQMAGKITRTSQIYKTEPWGFKTGEPFLNQAFEMHTALDPQALLDVLQLIEKRCGRTHTKASGYLSRTLDLDILLYDRIILETSSLCIPHRLLQERMFVLAPLCDLIPDYIHPVLKESIGALREKCADPLWIELYRH